MKASILLILSILILSFSSAQAAGGHGPEPHYPELSDGSTQYAAFPKPKEMYQKVDSVLIDVIKSRAKEDPFNIVATLIFFLAICHTFAASSLNKLAHHYEHEHEENLKNRGPRDD